MRLKLLIILLLILTNMGLILFHIWLFQSPWPYAAWISVPLHIAGFIIIPYQKIFK
jgi:hypothetical protein